MPKATAGRLKSDAVRHSRAGDSLKLGNRRPTALIFRQERRNPLPFAVMLDLGRRLVGFRRGLFCLPLFTALPGFFHSLGFIGKQLALLIEFLLASNRGHAVILIFLGIASDNGNLIHCPTSLPPERIGLERCQWYSRFFGDPESYSGFIFHGSQPIFRRPAL